MVVDIHSKVTKPGPKQTGHPLVDPKCSNRVTTMCNLVPTLVNPLSTPNNHMVAILASKPQVDMLLVGTSQQLELLQHSKPLREVVLMIITISNKLHKPNRLVALRQMHLLMGTVSKVKLMVKMGMEDMEHLNLVMVDMINKVMLILILQVDIIMLLAKQLMVKLAHTERLRVIVTLVHKLHLQHLHLNLVTGRCRQYPSQAMVLSLHLVMVVMDLLKPNLLLHLLMVSSHSNLHKVVMLNQHMDSSHLLMVVVGMLKHLMDSRHKHMERPMVVIPSNRLHILVMLQLLPLLLLQHLKLVVVRLPKLHPNKVDIFKAGKSRCVV